MKQLIASVGVWRVRASAAWSPKCNNPNMQDCPTRVWSPEEYTHKCWETYLQKLHESRFGFFSDPHCVFGVQEVVDVRRVNVSQHLFGKLRKETEESLQRQTTFPQNEPSVQFLSHDTLQDIYVQRKQPACYCTFINVHESMSMICVNNLAGILSSVWSIDTRLQTT